MSKLTKGRALTVEIFHDPDAENPCDEESQWRLYSFSNRHLSYRDPYDFFPDGKASPEFQSKLDEGFAWILSYFEHGQCRWMLSDEPKDMLAGDWRWDGVDVAGVLVWEHPLDELGPRTKQDRRADAAEFVDIYTSWCNGETYGYSITDSDDEEVSGYSGYIGVDNLISALREELEEGDEVVDVRDQVAGLTVENFRR
jgi:hypothetical protein